MTTPATRTGHCACGAVTFTMTGEPYAVHACHCTDCQRLTGGAYVVNAWIEAGAIEVTSGTPEVTKLKGGSGKDHDLYYCGKCATQLWSRFHLDAGDNRFVRVGCLDTADSLPIDIHIFTASKRPDTRIPEGALAFDRFYNLREVWPEGRIKRYFANC